MPIQIKFKSSTTLVADKIQTIEQLLAALSETDLASVCPQSFLLHYEDIDGDNITVYNTDDFLYFIEESEQSQIPKVLHIQSVENSEITLSLPKHQVGISFDQIIQEQMEKQLSLSVSKFKKEMSQTVRQLVEEQTKEYLSQSQVEKKEHLQADDIPLISQVVSKYIQKLQDLQDSILITENIKKAQEIQQQFKESLDQLKVALKIHFQKIKVQIKSKSERQVIKNQKPVQDDVIPKKEIHNVQNQQIGKLAQSNRVNVKQKVSKNAPKIVKQKQTQENFSEIQAEKNSSQLNQQNLVEESLEKPLIGLITMDDSINIKIQSQDQNGIQKQNEKEDQPKIQKTPSQIIKVVSEDQPCQYAKKGQQMIHDKQLQLNQDRARSLSKMFGFDLNVQSVLLALIKSDPQQTDDQVVNQIWDQIKGI